MKVATDYRTATELAGCFRPVFYSHFGSPLYAKTQRGSRDQHVIGRKYRGLFDEDDGSYVTLTEAEDGMALIDRDFYGSIPLYYSTKRPAISTDLRWLVELDGSVLKSEGLAEYLSAAYLTAGKTIYDNIRWLMPDEMIVSIGGSLQIKAKSIFPRQDFRTEQGASDLLERAIDNSIDDLLARFPGTVLLNLSGGTDSTLLLAKMRQKEPHKDIVTTTYFHEDWRDDIDDWKYADHASKTFGSRHQLTNINNETFCQSHRELLDGTRSVCHTYAAAFYAQNKVVGGLDEGTPILNGSGPDESIIGTEKVAIRDLLSLRSLEQGKWIDYLIDNIDYIKLSESTVTEMLGGKGAGFVQARKAIAERLLDSANFVEFQRKYHAVTILQNHIQELSLVARLLGRPILFPYLTNDIFKIIFSTCFETLNFNEIYKSVVKAALEKLMPKEFVHRTKIGFQSPSRPYFKSGRGLGRELSRLLSKGPSTLLNLDVVMPGIRDRLSANLDIHRRYDFLEWTAYNILLLEEFRGARA